MTEAELAQACRLIEALVFAAAEPVPGRAIAELLRAQRPPGDEALPDEVLAAVVERVRQGCEGRGVVLVAVAGGWRFQTAPDLAPLLTTVLPRPRRLPRAALEVLAIVAYHQPCTRAEIEAIRGVSLGQPTLDLLLEASLIVPRGRKEVPGRPTLWGTGAAFLRHFGLRDLGQLPRREELLLELPAVAAVPDG